MSNLLERAIVDANALKEAALKNAEQLVIEKYSQEVKQAVNKILEQEELAMDDPLAAGGMGGDLDLGGEEMAPTGEDPMAGAEEEEEKPLDPDSVLGTAPDAFNTDDDEIISIKLDSLEAEMEDEISGPFASGEDEITDDEIGIDILDDIELEDDTEVEAGEESPELDVDLGDVGIDITESVVQEVLRELGITADELGDALISDLNEQTELTPEEQKVKEELEGRTDGLQSNLTNEQIKALVKQADAAGIDPVEQHAINTAAQQTGTNEAVRVDFEPQKSGWAGTPEPQMREYESMLLAREQDTEVKEENEELRKAVKALKQENKTLSKKNKTLSSAAGKLQKQTEKYETAFNTLQEKLETMNVSNAKLLYINQALENASLNERQKRKIVEAISKADTVQEAKIVFDTMSDAVSTTLDVKRDSTLNEVVSRKSSLLVAARNEQTKKDANPMYNRLQRLAGIKTQKS